MPSTVLGPEDTKMNKKQTLPSQQLEVEDVEHSTQDKDIKSTVRNVWPSTSVFVICKVQREAYTVRANEHVHWSLLILR